MSATKRSFTTAVFLSLAVAPAFAQYRVEITPVLHSGDPAPGLEGLTIKVVRLPQIDGAGNVLFTVLVEGDGVNADNNEVLYHGQPGALQIIAREGEQAIGLPPGVVHSWSLSPDFSESGMLTFVSELLGPGIVENVNNMARWYGRPGEMKFFMQSGDPAPGTEPGTVFRWPSTFGARLNDLGDICIIADLTGPAVDGSNDQGVWIWSPDEGLELVSREGMAAPGTLGGRFLGASSWLKFNDAMEIAFQGSLVVEGTVNDWNNDGIWATRSGELTLMVREGEQAFGLPLGVFYAGANEQSFNGPGDVTNSFPLQGDVTPENDKGAWIFACDQTHLLGRKGDPVPGIGPGVFLATISSPYTNARRETLYLVSYGGPGVDETNKWAIWFGPYEAPRQELRDGEPAPHFPVGTTLDFVGGITGLVVMNDRGDLVSPTLLAGPDVTAHDAAVLWIRDRLRDDWVPLLRAGSTVAGRIVEAEVAGDLGNYWTRVNGSDGQRPSFNDAQQLAIELEFTDGTEGIYRIEPLWYGDSDSDADVDLIDYSALQNCFAVPALDEPCELLDAVENGFIDLFDARALVEGITGPVQ